MKHTKEPWTLWQSERDGCAVLSVGPSSVPANKTDVICDIAFLLTINETQKANARRIIACVNACSGMTTEGLETFNVNKEMRELAEERAKYKRQRDELLAALKDCIYTAENFGIPYAGRDARDRAKVIIKKYDHA
jgi:hypothetical protein